MNIEQMAQTCQQERQAYLQNSANPYSPVSLEMFRLAFSGDPEAWACLYQTFKAQVETWIGSQSTLEPEDIAQEAWLSFARYAPRCQNFALTETIGPILTYLRRCVRTTIVDMQRKLNRGPQDVTSLEDMETFHEPVATGDLAEEGILAATLQERIQQLVVTEKERLLFYLRFACNVPPREILAQHPETFADRQEVVTILHRLTRRLRQDPVLVELYGGC